MNRMYPNFAATCLGLVIQGSPLTAAPELYFYALNDEYVYNTSHTSLDDIDVSARIAKSNLVDSTVTPAASLLVDPLIDAFDHAVLSDVHSIVLVAEWSGGDSLLISWLDTWVNTGVPFLAPGAVDLSFSGNLVLRLGNVGPEA